MFPPIGRLPLPKSLPPTPTVDSFSDVIEEEEEVSWMTDGDEKQRYYDMEFNVEPKTSSRQLSNRRQPLSSRSSSHGTVGSIEWVDNKEDDWQKPYDKTQSDFLGGCVAASDEIVIADDIMGQVDNNGGEDTNSSKSL